MIIDLILDRKDGNGEDYVATDFYLNVMQYRDLVPEYADAITKAMDYGTEDDVRRALANYIVNAEYNLLIVGYINSVRWLVDDAPGMVIHENERFVDFVMRDAFCGAERSSIVDLTYETDYDYYSAGMMIAHYDEAIVVTYRGGNRKVINVSGDSQLAMIEEMFRNRVVY